MTGLFDTKRKYYTAPYALAGVTYKGTILRVVDRATTKELNDVVECNAKEGWLVHAIRNGDGSFAMNMDGEMATKRITGSFEIRMYPEDQPGHK